jgi:hypothetical protein
MPDAQIKGQRLIRHKWCNAMVTHTYRFQERHPFSSVHADSIVEDVHAPGQEAFGRIRAGHKKEAGQSIIEFAMVFSLFLILLLGGLDVAWDVNQKSNFDYVVTQAATCVDTTGCDPIALSAQTATGLGLTPANLTLTISGKTVTASYQGVSLTHFLPAITFSATITAP